MDQLVPGATQKVIAALLPSQTVVNQCISPSPLPSGPMCEVLQSLVGAFSKAHEVDHQNLMEEKLGKNTQCHNPQMVWPVPYPHGGEFYGFGRDNPTLGGIGHLAKDFNASLGDNVRSIDNGIVTNRLDPGEAGSLWLGVVIVSYTAPNGLPFYAMYAHLKDIDIAVQKGRPVSSSQVIGKIGDYPDNSGPDHLHFEIRVGPLATAGNIAGKGYKGTKIDSHAVVTMVSDVVYYDPLYFFATYY